MKRKHFVLFALLHTLLYAATLYLKDISVLWVGNPIKFPAKWVDFLPLAAALTVNFALLLFMAIKNKLNKRQVNIILLLDILLILPCTILFLTLLSFPSTSEGSLTIVYLYFINIVCLSGAITAKIIKNHKDKSST